jgi:hypothetical protein
VVPELPERGSKTSILPVVWAKFGIFSARSKWFPVVRDCWPCTKLGYITMTRRRSNNQRWHRSFPRPAAKNSVCKNPSRISRHDLLLTRQYPPHWLLPKDQTINAEYFSSLLVQLKEIWRKNDAGNSPSAFCSCTTILRLTGHLQPRRNWPNWASNVLITHPILRIWPRRITTCSLDW